LDWKMVSGLSRCVCHAIAIEFLQLCISFNCAGKGARN